MSPKRQEVSRMSDPGDEKCAHDVSYDQFCEECQKELEEVEYCEHEVLLTEFCQDCDDEIEDDQDDDDHLDELEEDEGEELDFIW
jgi:hypothetical protein